MNAALNIIGAALLLAACSAAALVVAFVAACVATLPA